jgi:hypothetical protein
MVFQIGLVAPILWRQFFFNGALKSDPRLILPPLEDVEEDQQQVIPKSTHKPGSGTVGAVHYHVPPYRSNGKGDKVVPLLLKQPAAGARHIVKRNVERFA